MYSGKSLVLIETKKAIITIESLRQKGLMMKIKDRIMLGICAGFGGNIAKRAIMALACKRKWAEFDGPVKAAGILLPAHKVMTTRGRIIGNICDFTISGLIGMGLVYVLSVTGKDHTVAKGALVGETAWNVMYGALGGKSGISTVYPVSTKTLLSQCAAHISYGMTAAYLIKTFGEEGLFTGDIPLSASSVQESKEIREVKMDQQHNSDLFLI